MHFKWTLIALMKYYLNVYNHNSCISNGHELLFHYYFNVCDNN